MIQFIVVSSFFLQDYISFIFPLVFFFLVFFFGVVVFLFISEHSIRALAASFSTSLCVSFAWSWMHSGRKRKRRNQMKCKQSRIEWILLPSIVHPVPSVPWLFNPGLVLWLQPVRWRDQAPAEGKWKKNSCWQEREIRIVPINGWASSNQWQFPQEKFLSYGRILTLYYYFIIMCILVSLALSLL